MDFFPSAEGGGRVVKLLGQPSYSPNQAHVGTQYTQGMYNNMVHIATIMLSKGVFEKATFNIVNILTN
jgi:hypothetical protein